MGYCFKMARAGKADKRGIPSTKKALDYLDELGKKHLNAEDQSMHFECTIYLREQLKGISKLESTNKRLSEKLDKILKTIKPENLIDLVKEL